MAQSASVSIVIVSFNVKTLLRECLTSLSGIPDEYEIIVVDNASSDGSQEMIKNEFPEVSFIDTGENIGFSPANNLAVNSSKADYILLLNPDTIVFKNTLQLWLKLHIESAAGLSGCRLLNSDRSLQISAWKTPWVLDSFLELLYLHRLFSITRYSQKKFSTDFEAQNVSGAAMLFSRDVYQKIGGLDPHLFWMEDTDLCYRISKVGEKVLYFYQPEIVHIGGQSSKTNYNRVISNQLISRLKFVCKHGSALSFYMLQVIIYLHVFSRIMLFGVFSLFKSTPKFKAYLFSLTRLNNYIWRKDMSI